MIYTAGGLASWQFTPEAYGAVGDGVHDDTTALQAARAAMIAYALSNQGYAELVLSAKRYRCATPAFVRSAATAGNALFSSPLVAATAQKVILVTRGTQEASVIPHWNQTVAQKAGAVIDVSDITGQVVDATYGLPSVFGGPTPQQGYGTAGNFNNVCERIDGLTVVAALNPTVAAFDWRGNGEATVGSVAALVNSVPSTLLTTPPTSSWSTGLFMPALLNNADSTIGSFASEGYYFATSLGPHTRFTRIFAAYCGYAAYIPATGSDKHGVTGWIEAEECNTAITTDASAGPNTPVHIVLDCEGINTYNAAFGQGYHVNDPSGALGGEISINDSAGNQATYKINGAANVRITAQNQPRGNVTPPAVPASTVALTNPFWRDADVRINGGTVTAITVDGAAIGGTAGSCMVPSGKTIAITYSVAPTWAWTLL